MPTCFLSARAYSEPRRAHPIIVNFGANWRITGQEYCWQLERHGRPKRGWRPVFYHGKLSNAVHSLFQQSAELPPIEDRS